MQAITDLLSVGPASRTQAGVSFAQVESALQGRERQPVVRVVKVVFYYMDSFGRCLIALMRWARVGWL